MEGSIVLNQFANIICQDFAVMRLPEFLLLIKPAFFARSMIVGNETMTLCFFSKISFR